MLRIIYIGICGTLWLVYVISVITSVVLRNEHGIIEFPVQ